MNKPLKFTIAFFATFAILVGAWFFGVMVGRLYHTFGPIVGFALLGTAVSLIVALVTVWEPKP